MNDISRISLFYLSFFALNRNIFLSMMYAANGAIVSDNRKSRRQQNVLLSSVSATTSITHHHPRHRCYYGRYQFASV